MFNSIHSRQSVCSFCLRLVVGLLTGQVNPAEQNAVFNSSTLGLNVFYALGMIESGNDDRGVGKAGEISRYQIHPSVWKSYSDSREYQNPDVALRVARRHWDYLSSYFRDKAGREPTAFDMYVLWNTRFGYYSRRGFDPARLSFTVRDRAQRFVNLLDRPVDSVLGTHQDQSGYRARGMDFHHAELSSRRLMPDGHPA